MNYNSATTLYGGGGGIGHTHQYTTGYGNPISNSYTIDCCQAAIEHPKCQTLDIPVPCAPKKKQEKKMYDLDLETVTITADERKAEFLAAQLTYAADRKTDAARREFGLADDEYPFTLTDVIKRIQDGKFVIPEGRGKETGYCKMDYIRWRDPAKKEDQDGYDAWRKTKDEAFTKTNRLINIMTPTEGLKALEEFEGLPIQ